MSYAQRLIAEKMRLQDGQAFIARLEAGGVDPRLSTIERYADALGCRFEWRLTDTEGNPIRGFETADLEPAPITLESLGVTPTPTGIDTKQTST
jgi:transcriptional regulator with XRE-family HTH domain